MRRIALFLSVVAAAAIAAPVALGGGFATTGLSSTPTACAPGSPGRSRSPCCSTAAPRPRACARACA